MNAVEGSPLPIRWRRHGPNPLTAYLYIHRMQIMAASPRHLTLRGVPPAVMRALDRERKRRDTSLNQTAIDALGQALGVAGGEPPDNGLAALAGTWSSADLHAFTTATRVFEQVDDELWK
jgi:hypothetical protein